MQEYVAIANTPIINAKTLINFVIRDSIVILISLQMFPRANQKISLQKLNSIH